MYTCVNIGVIKKYIKKQKQQQQQHSIRVYLAFKSHTEGVLYVTYHTIGMTFTPRCHREHSLGVIGVISALSLQSLYIPIDTLAMLEYNIHHHANRIVNIVPKPYNMMKCIYTVLE